LADKVQDLELKHNADRSTALTPLPPGIPFEPIVVEPETLRGMQA
jgi:hypothetical protein